MWINMFKCIVVGALCSWASLMRIEVVVLNCAMNLCSNVVVVILTYVVVELMQWVSLKWWIGDEYVVVVVESCGNWWIGEFWWD